MIHTIFALWMTLVIMCVLDLTHAISQRRKPRVPINSMPLGRFDCLLLFAVPILYL